MYVCMYVCMYVYIYIYIQAPYIRVPYFGKPPYVGSIHWCKVIVKPLGYEVPQAILHPEPQTKTLQKPKPQSLNPKP